MTPEDLQYFKELLLTKRQETIEEIEEFKALNKDREEASENSAYPFHMAELGTDAQEREKSFMFAERLNSYLNHVNEALYRIEKGNFGICSECGCEISKERLEAVPHTQLCVDCKLKKK
jgi:RNA polymerase-binding protein DksA